MSTPVVDTIEVLELDSCVSMVRLDRPSDADPSELVPVTLAELTDITLTLYGKTPDEIINSRSGVSVKNAAGGTFHATTGEFTVEFESADIPILLTTPAASIGKKQVHYAFFVATWGSGGRKSRIVEILVENLHRVP